ncbi:MAG: TlpA family protein disulfide reductase [Gammaproteobacteria bacterium]|nr:TlpA family protein disulfide reductase [Gammaproteobacteria bacterium]
MILDMNAPLRCCSIWPAGLFLLYCAATTAYAGSFEIRVDAQTTITVERFAAQGDALLLWLPSEHGFMSTHATLAKLLALQGIEVWNADLFAAYFAAPSSSTLAAIPDTLVALLIDRASTQSKKRIYLISNDQGTALLLRGARLWQTQHTRSNALGGALLISPNLLTQTPEAGQDAVYLPIAAATNLPVFILQPVLAAGRWRITELVTQLERGGSSVYIRRLQDVRDRFFFRPDATVEETRLTEHLAPVIRNAIELLAREQRVRRAANLVSIPTLSIAAPNEHRLRDYHGEPQPWPLALPDRSGNQHVLAQSQGKVVLLNFWASWCPPCVQEMPALQQLKARWRNQPFEILAVNMAEPNSTIDAFMRRQQLDFTVLLDRDGHALRQWKIMAFPTSFVLDKHGRIRYAVFGAIDWLEQETVQKIALLLQETR